MKQGVTQILLHAGRRRCAAAALQLSSAILRSTPLRISSAVAVGELYQQRALTSSAADGDATANAGVVPELIELDCITVETVEEVMAAAACGGSYSAQDSSTVDVHLDPTQQSSGEKGESAAAEGSPATAAGDGGATFVNMTQVRGKYWNVHKVDAFARGRVLNYLRRMGFKGTGSPFQTKASPVTDGQVGGDDHPHRGGLGNRVASVLYTATLRLPLPAPHGSYVAEGVGETIKDAELLAAMHAERVCDALGVPLFRLPSMQQKYAENVRRTEGRYAPLPGDPLQPEGTAVPPPLRMVSAAMAGAEGSSGGDMASTKDPLAEGGASSVEAGSGGRSSRPASSLFSSGIAEAELVETKPSRFTNVPQPTAAATASSCQGHEQQQKGSGGVGGASRSNGNPCVAPTDVAGPGAEWVQAYRAAMVYPWGTATNATGSPPQSQANASNAGYDPTEGGCWQLTNLVSNRMPPSKEALALPCVLDPEALERMTDHFLQREVPRKLADCFTVTHVVHPGSASRMYVAELDLHQRSLHAMGKAQNKEVAKQLAAMHAELLLDSMGLPMFPGDDSRQTRHAAAAREFGRWAVDPADPEGAAAQAAKREQQPDAPLPLPLKQMVGGDEVWLDASAGLHPTYQRSEAERVIAAQSELNFLCSNALEVFPPEALLEEAEAILHNWQRDVAQNPYPGCYIITKMGDFYRAATLTPVPRRFGVRGGIAIARSPAQAVGLCALHAIDSLSALGVPVFVDPTEQRRFIERRRAMGMPTPELFLGLAHPRDWQPLQPSVVHESKLAEEVSNMATVEQLSPPTEAAAGTSFYWWKYLQDALTHNYAATTNTDGVRRPALVPPYLPAYLIEGNQPRRLPHAQDTSRVLQLGVLSDFDEFGKDCREEELIAIGNEVKICVHNYLRHQYAIGGCGTDKIHLKTSVVQKGSVDGWHLPPPLVPSVCITGYGRTGASVHNIAYLRLPPPTKRQPLTAAQRGVLATATGGPPLSKKKMRRLTSCNSAAAGQVEELVIPQSETSATDNAHQETEAGSDSSTDTYVPLAVGLSLKKKDAERACYLHAASLLYHVYGEDVMAKHRAGLPRLSVVSSFDMLVDKCFKGLDYAQKKQQRDQEEQQRRQNNSSSDIPMGKPAERPLQSAPRLPPPKGLIHTTMKTFVSAGRYVTSTAGGKPSHHKPRP